MVPAHHQTMAIRQSRKTIASTSAVQTIWVEAFWADAGEAGLLRIFTPHHPAETKKASDDPRPLLADNRRLFQRGVDRGELGVQVGAEAVNDRNDRERDAGCNQAVFDRGGAGFILHESSNKGLHQVAPCIRG